MQTHQNIEAILQKLGYTKKEVEIYLHIQTHGALTPSQVAKQTGINRTTVYSVAKELLKRGVITEDLGKKQRLLVATHADALAGSVRLEQKMLDEKKRLVNGAMRAMKEMTKDARYSIPKIQFVPQERMEDFIYKRADVWDASILERDGSYLGFQEQAFVEQYAKYIEWYWQRAPKGIKLNLLSNDSDAEQYVASSVKTYSGNERKITFWKKDLRFTATTWVMGDYVVMFVLSSKPQYLVEMHDAVFAQNQRVLFQTILEDL